MTEPSVRPLVDVNRSAVLTLDLDAAVAVHPDGSESLWLLVPGDNDGPASPPPAHEQTGPLPERYQRRLAQPRCRESRPMMSTATTNVDRRPRLQRLRCTPRVV